MISLAEEVVAVINHFFELEGSRALTIHQLDHDLRADLDGTEVSIQEVIVNLANEAEVDPPDHDWIDGVKTPRQIVDWLESSRLAMVAA